MHNHVILTGRLTHTPELRQTTTGVFICRFSIAVQRKYNKNKKAEQEVDFIDLEAWRGTAEFVSKYFDKGDMIDVTGRLKTYRWKDDNGNTYFSTTVLVESVNFAPTNNHKPAESNSDTTIAYAQAQDSPADLEKIEEYPDGNLPF